jgi:hypothetical protein
MSIRQSPHSASASEKRYSFRSIPSSIQLIEIPCAAFGNIGEIKIAIMRAIRQDIENCVEVIFLAGSTASFKAQLYRLVSLQLVA